MALDLRLEQKMSQQLVMTPQLQQAIKLLQLSHLELADVLREELEQNPILEERADGAGENPVDAPGDEPNMELSAAGPEAIQPPPSTVASPGPGRRTTVQAKNAAGVGRQARYASKSVGPYRPDPAVTSVIAGSALVAATLPVPPPLTNSRSACSRTAWAFSSRA